MTNEVKQRLYVTAIVVAMASLYIAPLIVSSHFNEVKKALFEHCTKEFPAIGFEFCWVEARSKAELPFWEYLVPFFPAALALWLNWLLKPDLRLSEDAYPKRTIKFLLWLGLLVAALAVWLPLSQVATWNAADLYKIESQTFWRAPWIAAAWLAAPMLFHYLLAPVSLAASMRKGKIGLWLLAATPVASFALYALRESLKA